MPDIQNRGSAVLYSRCTFCFSKAVRDIENPDDHAADVRLCQWHENKLRNLLGGLIHPEVPGSTVRMLLGFAPGEVS
jgi:hypothetical protein